MLEDKLDLKLYDIENLFYDTCTGLPTRIALEYHERNREFKTVIYVKMQELKKIEIYIDRNTYKEAI